MKEHADISLPLLAVVNPSVLVLTVGLVGLFAFFMALSSYSSQRNRKGVLLEDHEKVVVGSSSITSIPTGFENFRDFFKTLNDPDAPQIFLTLSREMNSPPTIKVPMMIPFINKHDFYVVNDYNVARKVLEDPQSTKWKVMGQFFSDTTGGANFVTEDGHRWKHVRKSTMAAFSNKNIKKVVETVDVVMARWMQDTLESAVSSSGKGIDILDEMTKVTANVIAEAAFDYHLSDVERITFLQNLRICWDEFAINASKSSFVCRVPYLRFLYSGMREGKHASKNLQRQCKIMLAAYRSKVAMKGPSARQPHKLIDMLVNDTEYANEEERVRDMIAYVIAGFDTTANTISFALMELGRHPEEQRKLREALQKYKTEEEARTCLELQHVVRETLRLRPAFPLGSVRVLKNDINVQVHSENDEETHNIFLPSGSRVMTCFFTIQRDAKVFKNPDMFIPSRWEDPSESMNKSILTFSLGRRNCQGQALAYAEMTELLMKICLDYEINIVNDGKPTNIVLYKPLGTVLSFTKV